MTQRKTNNASWQRFLLNNLPAYLLALAVIVAFEWLLSNKGVRELIIFTIQMSGKLAIVVVLHLLYYLYTNRKKEKQSLG